MQLPAEYLKIKYAAPTGACKCGDCQLVPHKVIREWADEIERLQQENKELKQRLAKYESNQGR